MLVNGETIQQASYQRYTVLRNNKAQIQAQRWQQPTPINPTPGKQEPASNEIRHQALMQQLECW